MNEIPRMSFKEYFEAKRKLKAAGEDSPRYYSLYEVNKYCKIPLLESIENNEKVYIALKPKDKIKILWELTDLVNPIPKYIAVINEESVESKYFFSWNLSKINKWIETTTFKK